MRHRRNNLVSCLLVLVLACDKESESGSDSGSGSEAAETESTPEQCLPRSFGETDPYLELCKQAYNVRQCCGTWALQSPGLEPWNMCAESFTRLHFPTDPAPAECSELVETAVRCVIDVAAESCAAMADFETGLYSSEEDFGPPTDAEMPCFQELIAAWDAGCEPYLHG